MVDGEAQTPDNGVPETPETQNVEQQAPETIFDGVETEPPTKEEPTEELVNTPEKPPEDEAETQTQERPDWLPEKFKTPEDLVKAYNEMGAKIREKNEPPESYEITVTKGDEQEAIELTEGEVEAFREAGLSNEQAQKITQYFHDKVVPEIIEAKAAIEKDRLALEWGMDASSNAFTQQLAQVKAWAQQNLPDSVVTELSRSAAGVRTMANMMEQGAQGQRVTGNTADSRPDKSQLMEMMNDERYWNGDETYRDYVRQQFQKAFD